LTAEFFTFIVTTKHLICAFLHWKNMLYSHKDIEKGGMVKHFSIIA